MNATTDHPNATPAAKRYARHADEIAALIDLLQIELQAHGKRAGQEPANWGFAGDLAQVRRDLITTVAQLTGVAPDEIKEHLAEVCDV